MIAITEVRIHLLEPSNSNLLAYANITFDDCFVVHGVKVIQGERGLFVGMPRRKKQDGKSQDIAHPVNTETRRYLEKRVIEAYNKARQQERVNPQHIYSNLNSSSIRDEGAEHPYE